jgi:hypothetical protein
MKIQSVSQQNFKAGGMLYKKKDHTLKYKLVSFGPDGEVSNSLQFSVDIVNNASDASISGFPVVASALRDASGTYYTSAQDLFEDLEIVITDTSIVNIVGPIGPVGPAGLAWKGVWNVATAYIVNDAVSFGGASYFCIVNVTGGSNPPANATNWALLASQGAQGPAGSNASPQTFQEVLTIGNTSTLPAVFQSATATTIVESGNVGAATSQKRVNLNGTDGVVYEKDLTGSPKRLVLDAVNALTANRTQFLQDKDGTVALLSDVQSTTQTYDDNLVAGNTSPYPLITTNLVRVSSASIDRGVTLPDAPSIGTQVRVGNKSNFTIIVNSNVSNTFYLNGIGSDLPFIYDVEILSKEEYLFVYVTAGVWSAYSLFKEESIVTKVLKTTVTEAQILTLFSSPLIILASDEVGKVRYPINVYIYRNTGNAYTLASTSFSILNGTNLVQAANINASPMTSNQQGYFHSSISIEQNQIGTNQNVLYKLRANVGNPTSGSGTLELYTTYVEITL